MNQFTPCILIRSLIRLVLISIISFLELTISFIFPSCIFIFWSKILMVCFRSYLSSLWISSICIPSMQLSSSSYLILLPRILLLVTFVGDGSKASWVYVHEILFRLMIFVRRPFYPTLKYGWKNICLLSCLGFLFWKSYIFNYLTND